MTTDKITNPAKKDAERLAELVHEIKSAYQENKKCDGMVVDWKDKQLRAGIKVGKHLLEAKLLLPFKEFGKWCKDNFQGLTHRTLNRYMKVAAKETRVSKVPNSLTQAYKDSTDTGRKRKSVKQTDFHQIKQHLSKVKNLLNNYQDMICSDEADLVCNLVDAINIWVSDYRSLTEKNRLNKARDKEFEKNLGIESRSTETKQIEISRTE